jgi:peptide deformylase
MDDRSINLPAQPSEIAKELSNLKIIEYPDDRLRVKCKSVETVTPELAKLAKEMYTVMKAANGVGLAANQVGLDVRLIVLDNKGLPLYMFNPKVLQESKDKHTDGERCLSFPNVTKKIPRAIDVIVKYRDINNGRQHIKLEGILARAVLHEIDHLDAILLCDKEEKS